MNKFKVSDIFLIVAALAIVAMLIYTISMKSSGEEVEKVETEATQNPPTSEELKSRAIQWSEDPETLRGQLRNASRDETLSFMSYVRERGIPEGYEYPQFLLDAGSGKESARLIGERFPEFYGLGGDALINAAKRYPVKYVEMIEYSLAYREIYAHEVEHLRKEQAEKEAAQKR